jgi:hypothetical protein
LSVVLFFLYLPNLFTLIERFSLTVNRRNWVPEPHISEFYGNINRFLNSRFSTAILIVFLIIFLVQLIFEKQFKNKLKEISKNKNFKIILLWFLISYGAMFLISFKVPIFLDRYIAYSTIFLYLLIAIFFAYLCSNKIISYVFMFSLSIVMALNFTIFPSNNRNVQELVSTIKKIKLENSDAPIIISPEYSNLEFTYYYNSDYFRDYSNINLKLISEKIYPSRDLTGLPENTLNTEKIIYLDCGSEFAFGKNLVLNKLNERYTVDSTIHVHETYNIYLLSKKY